MVVHNMTTWHATWLTSWRLKTHFWVCTWHCCLQVTYIIYPVSISYHCLWAAYPQPVFFLLQVISNLIQVIRVIRVIQAWRVVTCHFQASVEFAYQSRRLLLVKSWFLKRYTLLFQATKLCHASFQVDLQHSELFAFGQLLELLMHEWSTLMSSVSCVHHCKQSLFLSLNREAVVSHESCHDSWAETWTNFGFMVNNVISKYRTYVT
jgi:hypothetical protein